MSLKKLVDHCTRHHFLSQNLDRFSFLGNLLREKVEKEWCFDNFTHNNGVSFPIEHCSDNSSPLNIEIVNNLVNAKSLMNGESAISFAYKSSISGQSKCNQPLEEWKTLVDLIKPWPATYMNLSMFSLPTQKLEDFTRLQKKRRLWWKALLQQPELLNTTTADDDFSSTHHLLEQRIVFSSSLFNDEPFEILSIWKPQIFENLQLSDEMKQSVMTKYQRKSTWPCLITLQIRLELATLFFLVDAFSKNNKNATLSLHNSLAPYSVGVAVGIEAENSLIKFPLRLEELHNLQRLICLKLSQQRQISVLPVSSSWSIPQCDARAVPYSIMLTDETLEQGICSLRSRDTTLKEQVHVSEIVERASKYVLA